MKKQVIFLLFGVFCFLSFQKEIKRNDTRFLSYSTHPKNIKFFSTDKNGIKYGSFKNVNQFLNRDKKTLRFAMNGGMYKKDLTPQGLYIENGNIEVDLDTINKGFGNFYLQPNGIFYITEKNEAYVCPTTEFALGKHIKSATQSGPMLVVDGKLHPKLNKGSSNTHIRNGVGVLPNGNLLFAMSKEKVNFYDFASFFKNRGCEDALYLDGFVSRTYLPSQDWVQETGRFGVIIAEIEKL